MRRPVVPWVVAVVLLLVVTGSGVLVARSTVFSASSFVQTYLDALARGDASGALELPGVRIPAARTDLLRTSGLTSASDAHTTGERPDGDVRVVTVAWRHAGTRETTELRVRETGAVGGLLPRWRFATSPIATTRLEISGGTTVRVGGTRVDPAAVQKGTPRGAPFALLVPGAWTVDLDDRMVTLADRELVHQKVGTASTLTVAVQPTAAFTAAVRGQVRKVLAACAKQTVLYPPGCPFGEQVTDRLASTPAWSIVDAPRIRLSPGDAPGQWTTAPTSGTAHLRVKVRSIFDGTVSDFDQDVDFVAAWNVRLDGSTVTLGALLS